MNSLYLSNHSYESFIYVEGDAIFSKEDISKLKNLKIICEKDKKEALFFKYPDFLSSVVFYSSIDFFKNTCGNNIFIEILGELITDTPHNKASGTLLENIVVDPFTELTFNIIG